MTTKTTKTADKPDVHQTILAKQRKRAARTLLKRRRKKSHQ